MRSARQPVPNIEEARSSRGFRSRPPGCAAFGVLSVRARGPERRLDHDGTDTCSEVMHRTWRPGPLRPRCSPRGRRLPRRCRSRQVRRTVALMHLRRRRVQRIGEACQGCGSCRSSGQRARSPRYRCRKSLTPRARGLPTSRRAGDWTVRRTLRVGTVSPATTRTCSSTRTPSGARTTDVDSTHTPSGFTRSSFTRRCVTVGRPARLVSRSAAFSAMIRHNHRHGVEPANASEGRGSEFGRICGDDLSSRDLQGHPLDDRVIKIPFRTALPRVDARHGHDVGVEPVLFQRCHG